MEILRECTVSTEAQYITEWPKVLQLSLMAVTQTKDDGPEPRPKPRIEGRNCNSQETDPSKTSKPAHLDLEGSLKTVSFNDTDQPQAVKSTKTQLSEGPWSRMRRLTLKRTLWRNPNLSIGTKCSRMGDNECCEAIGPAQAMFAQISQPIGDLLDTLIEEIEEGEPVAGNILMYGIYMIGRDLSTARPTLIFTCQRPKPRRRAIKFVKESGILKALPKIALAESSKVPMALGKGYPQQLSGPSILFSGSSSTIWIPKRDTTTTSSSGTTPSAYNGLSTGAKAGIGVGVALGAIVTVPEAADPELPKPSSWKNPLLDTDTTQTSNNPRFLTSLEEFELADPEPVEIDGRQILPELHGMSMVAPVSPIWVRASSPNNSLCSDVSHVATAPFPARPPSPSHSLHSSVSNKNSDESFQTPFTDQNGDLEFAFDSGEEDEIDDVGAPDEAITSQASGNSKTGDNDIPCFKEVSIPYEVEEWAGTIRSSTNPVTFAAPCVLSSKMGRDWALIELSETSVREALDAVSKDKSFSGLILLGRIASSMPTKDMAVMAIKGRSGVSGGTLSPIEGDSGSWVIDKFTGDLYGHIIAGVPESGVAYILPANKTFRDIEEVLGPIDLVSKTLQSTEAKAIGSGDDNWDERGNTWPAPGSYHNSVGGVKDVGTDETVISVAAALEIARDSPEGAQDPTVVNTLETAIADIWRRIEAKSTSYVMARDAFAVFNYFQSRFEGQQLATDAAERYRDSLHLSSGN
ncbi:uncharacterized protein PAC_08839 [Phialocephala subalpina]|uniref:Uncharacterized protein n=1 Tax=Phialocephala subalpina TaxID=576137 RepID=A0A1L7X1Q7_9HELO|nr:uncharacterized protein PAC_08839 [Phialocephala subalpina]